MEEHQKGPRSRGLGSIISGIMAGAKFGDVALAAVEIFRTDGAGSGTGFMQIQPTYAGGVAALPGMQPAIAAQTVATPKKYPLIVQFFGHILTAFDGAGPVFNLVETNLDDSGSVNIATIAGFAGGFFSAFKILIVDKKYKITYTPGAGATVGEGYYFIKLAGPGIMRANIPATTMNVGGV